MLASSENITPRLQKDTDARKSPSKNVCPGDPIRCRYSWVRPNGIGGNISIFATMRD